MPDPRSATTDPTAIAPFDRWPCPAVLVDAQLRVHRRNWAVLTAPDRHAGLLAQADGQWVLRPQDRARPLREAVRRVLQDRRHPAALSLPRVGCLPLTLRVAEGPQPHLAMVAFRDPHGTSVDPGLLGGLFGLTPTEAQVAACLCDGRTLSQIADALQVQSNTVQIHVKRALAKCGVSRQPQLVALLLRSVAASDAWPPCTAPVAPTVSPPDPMSDALNPPGEPHVPSSPSTRAL